MADRLLAAIEELNESIVLTDPEDRFVIANRAFRELNRNIPDSFRPGQKFVDYLRAGIAAGNYPDAVGREKEWLEARLEERRNPGRPVERQRSGGRWFLIDDRRLADGSTIRFGTDITERKRAQAESNERGRELQLIVDSVPQMITRLDREERFLFANRAYAALMERPVEEIVGRGIAELVTPEVYAQIRPAIRRALAGDPVSVERVQVRSNGEPVELEGRYIPDVDVEGRVIGLIAVHRDVTAERRAQRSLAESEARFRGAFQLGLIGMAITSPDRKFVDVNDAFCRMLGYSREQLVGRPWTQFTHSGDLAANVAQLERALAGTIDAYSMHKRYLRADGGVMDADVAVSCVRDPDGALRHFVLMIQDITERKRAELTLMESEARFRSLATLSSDWYWEQDENFRNVDVSEGVEERGGMDKRGRMGKARWELPNTGITEKQWDEHRAQLERHESFRDFQYGRRGENGETVWFSVSGEPFFDAQGRFKGYRGVGQNITARKNAEETLKQSEARFRSLTALSSDWYWEQDADFRFTFMSGDLDLNTGISSDAHIGKTRWDMPTLNVTEDGWASHRALLARHEPFRDFEMRRPDRDGRLHWVSISGEPVFDGEGRFRGYRGIGRDITARKAEEQARVAGEALKSAMLASALDAIVSFDAAGCILEFNPAAERCFGWTRAETLGRSVADLLIPEDVREQRRRELDTLANNDATPFGGKRVEMHALRRDGRRILIEISVARLPNVSPPVFTAFLRDITDRKGAQEALAESEARFRALFERSSAGMAITDVDGIYLSVNAAFTRFFGYSAEELVGRLGVSDLRLPDDAQGAVLYQRLISGEIGYFERDQKYQRKDGAHIWGRVTVSSVRDAGGKAMYVVAVFSDITEEVHARARTERMNAELEERVEQRTADLRAALKELDAFTYSVSHDLRAPIGAVSSFAHLLRNAEAPRLSEDGRRLLDYIEQNAERMTRLIEGLLRFSRLGRSDLRRSRVSMNGLAGDSLLDFVDQAARADISASPMPDCEGDPALLGQVWSNLVGNALKYSRGANPQRIEIGWDAGHNAYYVRDNGVGFDMSYAGKLFGVFERLHSEAEFEGNGIGLAIAERIVRLHRGAIWAKAAPGKGATFWFTVPAAAPGATAELRSSPEARR